MPRRSIFALVHLLVLPSATLAAEPFVPASGLDGAGLGVRDDPTGRVWLDSTAFWDDRSTALAPIVGAGIFPTDGIEVEGGVPFAVSDEGADLGNPFVGGTFVYTATDLRLRAGLRAALPVATSDGLFSSPLFLGGLSRGLTTVYLYGTDSWALVPHARLELDASDLWVVTVDGALQAVLPVRNRRSGEALIDVAPGVALRPLPELTLGLRAPLSFILTGDDDAAQASLEPYVRGQLGRVFLSARFAYNVDAPLGPSFDDGGLWNVGLGAGVSF